MFDEEIVIKIMTTHMAMRVVHRQHRTHGEGGLLTLILAADLVSAALAQPSCAPLHRHLAVLAYKQALDWCVDSPLAH